MSNEEEEEVIIFIIHDQAKLKENIPTELRINPPTLKDGEEIFIIKKDSDLDDQFPSSLVIKKADLLELNVVSFH